MGVQLQAADVARFKVYRRDAATPDLDLSETATANGSDTNPDNANPTIVTVTINEDDVSSLEPGVYRAELLYDDDSDSSRQKTDQDGILQVIGTAGGS